MAAVSYLFTTIVHNEHISRKYKLLHAKLLHFCIYYNIVEKQCLLALAVCATAAPTVLLEQLRPEPVPILKQINQVNDDGSYTFGFEAGDGSFRVETKTVDGQTIGKYGYIDEFGVQQVIGKI